MDSRVRSTCIAEFLEAVYRLDVDDHTWLVEIMRAARAVANRGHAMHGAIYDASDVAALRIETIHAVDVPDGALEWLVESVKWATPEFVATTFRSQLVDTASASNSPEWHRILRGLHQFGFADSLNVNGADPHGTGAFFVIWRGDADRIPEGERVVYRRMAHHLAAAYRFRRRLNEQRQRQTVDLLHSAEAILDASGHVVHAAGAARSKSAQAELLQTARDRDDVRASVVSGEVGIRRWRPLTSARWSLVDVFERNGKRYVVAQENESVVPRMDLLTGRERQVVAYLAIGQSTKEAAYALGISDATVRVLLRRAVSKLGVRTRSELLNHPDVRRLSPRHASTACESTSGVRHTSTRRPRC